MIEMASFYTVKILRMLLMNVLMNMLAWSEIIQA